MAFAFHPGEPVDAAARRVARKQLRKAIEALDQPDVHDARKRTKRVRAVARLVRPGIGKRHRPVDHPARDAARALAPAREGQVLVETFDALGPEAPAEVRDRLMGAGEPDVDAARSLLADALDAVHGWQFDDGVGVLAAGLRATYRRGRRAFLDPDDLHEWRKWTQHLWHQTQLLAPAAPELLDPQAEAFHELAELLGDEHDLAVLTEAAADDRVTALARVRREALTTEALELGARLYVEKPKAFAARMTGLWTTA
jgi:hypothetical protein